MNENQISKIVFETGLQVHRSLGPGLLESAYQECLYYELNKLNIAVEKQKLNSYDVILMDLSMPVMDGYEATINIRLKDVSVPIIALTASASYGYLEKAALLGINEYILKPFNPKELNLKLRKHFKNIFD